MEVERKLPLKAAGAMGAGSVAALAVAGVAVAGLAGVKVMLDRLLVKAKRN